LPEVAQVQKVLGVDGLIVDPPLETATAVHDLEKQQQQMHDELQMSGVQAGECPKMPGM